MMIQTKVKELSAGGVLQVVATDHTTTRDMSKFCSFLGYTLREQADAQGVFTFYIQKP